MKKQEHRDSAHQHNDDHSHDHDHDHGGGAGKQWVAPLFSGILLVMGLLFEHVLKFNWFADIVRLAWYIIAYLPVGFPVVMKGVRLALKGQVFTEFFLMGVATVGAFYLGDYPEGVTVMLFYAIGELFQDAAVNRAKNSIKALLDVRPDITTVLRNGKMEVTSPELIAPDEIIQIKSGERVSLDGQLIDDEGTFNTSALTGESRPRSIHKDEAVLAGMINDGHVVTVKVTKPFNDSALSRILKLVQDAQGRKAKTELFVRRFAAVYTPVVVLLAITLTFLPYLIVDDYQFNQWLYRALVFLVISCPCALVVAIPLGYFGGIGAGSRNGILFKGSTYLDLLSRVKTVALDKTGTLTKGVFKVQRVEDAEAGNSSWFRYAAALEKMSTHPVARAIVMHAGADLDFEVKAVEEIKGHGLTGNVGDKMILAGNAKLLKKYGVSCPESIDNVKETIVLVAVDNVFAGYITIADEIKEDASEAISRLHRMGVSTAMLSGDKQSVVDHVAHTLQIDIAHGDLLPEGKVEKVTALRNQHGKPIAFVGDGINDAPVLAISDVGIAMGGLGSDAAIETADVVIQTDQPSHIAVAIEIGKATNRIVWQNIGLAFAVKVVVMVLGAWGMASMWEAVFADVGVALMAIVNAVRIQRMKFL